jgi:hypothetical protein
VGLFLFRTIYILWLLLLHHHPGQRTLCDLERRLIQDGFHPIHHHSQFV